MATRRPAKKAAKKAPAKRVAAKRPAAKKAPAKKAAPRAAPPKPPRLGGSSELLSAVEQGSRREVLVALRRRLATALGVAEPNEVAALAREFRAVEETLAGLGAAEEESPSDELRRAAAERFAAS